MLIVCPSCASEYMIDPGRLGVDGRTVRCAKCKSTWFVAPEENLTAAAGAAPGTEGNESESHMSDASSEAALESFPASRAEDGLRAAARAASAGAGHERRFAAAGPALLLAALVALGSAIWCRAHIVRLFPATATLYAGIGLPVNVRGLEFRGVRSELVGSGGEAILVVEGEIANISGRDASVPPIEIGVRGAEGQMLYTWANDPPRRTLAVSDAIPFRARLAAPPSHGREVLVRFAPSRDDAAVASHAR